MTNITWIDGGTITEEESVAERFMRLEHNDPRELLMEGCQEHAEWLEEAGKACDDVIEEYLYSIVTPSTLPQLLERKITGADYSVSELDGMAYELLGREPEMSGKFSPK